MLGAKAEVQAFPDRVALEVPAQLPNNEGAASVTLFEVTPTGDVQIAQAGSASLWAHLPIPRPGMYFAEITDARRNKYRTQKVPVEQGFFDLAAQRWKEEREFKAQAEAKQMQANADAAARAVVLRAPRRPHEPCRRTGTG